jgi:hypothetical protein
MKQAELETLKSRATGGEMLSAKLAKSAKSAKNSLKLPT